MHSTVLVHTVHIYAFILHFDNEKFPFFKFRLGLKAQRVRWMVLEITKNTDNGQRPETARYAAVVCDRDQKAARAKEEYTKYRK
jgi:hypothetical protein